MCEGSSPTRLGSAFGRRACQAPAQLQPRRRRCLLARFPTPEPQAPPHRSFQGLPQRMVKTLPGFEPSFVGHDIGPERANAASQPLREGAVGSGIGNEHVHCGRLASIRSRRVSHIEPRRKRAIRARDAKLPVNPQSASGRRTLRCFSAARALAATHLTR